MCTELFTSSRCASRATQTVVVRRTLFFSADADVSDADAAGGAVALAQIDSALNTMIYCFTVPCAQALDLLPTDYEAYRCASHASPRMVRVARPEAVLPIRPSWIVCRLVQRLQPHAVVICTDAQQRKEHRIRRSSKFLKKSLPSVKDEL